MGNEQYNKLALNKNEIIRTYFPLSVPFPSGRVRVGLLNEINSNKRNKIFFWFTDWVFSDCRFPDWKWVIPLGFRRRIQYFEQRFCRFESVFYFGTVDSDFPHSGRYNAQFFG